MTATEHVQRHQPEGVPPLELTGERTLPDVPEENYWFRRHLAVYGWIAERCGGLDVVDMACGEGYGTDLLARRAARVTGVDANPDAHEHAKLKYTRPGVRFVRDLVETYDEPCDAVVFLQTIEHVEKPEEVLGHFREMLRPGGTAYVSTPNVLTLAPPGPSARATPGTCASTAPRSSARCASRASTRSSCSACSTPASCARTSWRCAWAGTRCTRRWGSPSRSTTGSPRDRRQRLRAAPGPALDAHRHFVTHSE